MFLHHGFHACIPHRVSATSAKRSGEAAALSAIRLYCSIRPPPCQDWRFILVAVIFIRCKSYCFSRYENTSICAKKQVACKWFCFSLSGLSIIVGSAGSSGAIIPNRSYRKGKDCGGSGINKAGVRPGSRPAARRQTKNRCTEAPRSIVRMPSLPLGCIFIWNGVCLIVCAKCKQPESA